MNAARPVTQEMSAVIQPVEASVNRVSPSPNGNLLTVCVSDGPAASAGVVPNPVSPAGCASGSTDESVEPSSPRTAANDLN